MKPNEIAIILIIDNIAKEYCRIMPKYDILALDPLFERICDFLRVDRPKDIVLAIMNRLAIGYMRTKRILEQLEEMHIIYDFGDESYIIIDNEYIDESKLDCNVEYVKKNFGNEIRNRVNYYEAKNKRIEFEKLEIEEIQKKNEIEDIKERIMERNRIRDLEKIAMQELIDEGVLFPESNKRPPIPKDIVDAIYRRDGGKCVYCGSTKNLHIDHIIPFSKGGDTVFENLQLLCRDCNLKKSNKIG